MKLLVLFCALLFVQSVRSEIYIRTNNFAFLPESEKTVVILSTEPLVNTTLAVFSGHHWLGTASLVASGEWNDNYNYTYQANLTSLRAVGNYTMRLRVRHRQLAVKRFSIVSASAYSQLLENSLFFFRAQRDGPDIDLSVMRRKPSHLTDKEAYVYATPNYTDEELVGTLQRTGGPIDVSGGWFDAGDYQKLVHTASFVVSLMAVAQRDYAPNNTNLQREVHYGLDWLLKMWNDSNSTMYTQVGIGAGNSNITGDHDVWRLPEEDDKLNTSIGDSDYYIKYRPVFYITDEIPPNLAGRMAGAFALCAQLYNTTDQTLANRCLENAKHIYAHAQVTNVTQLVTAYPFEFYPESEWRDDMEFGAIELYKATGEPFYLQEAGKWAKDYIDNAEGKEFLNLYDIAGLAHYELYKTISQGDTNISVDASELINDRESLLRDAEIMSNSDPFHFGANYSSGYDLVPLAFGVWLESSFYNELTNSTTFQELASYHNNWIFGENAWGASFVIGAGSTFPQCPQHQVANLAGSLNGTSTNNATVLYGGVVDGPSQAENFEGLGVPDGARECSALNPFSPFDGKGVKYVDNVIAWPSVEPADDYTVLSLLAFARTAKYGI